MRRARRLTKSAIADWARAHRARSGQWPTAASGPIPESRGDTWGTINTALILGTKGLPGGTTLDEFLSFYRFNPFPHIKRRPAKLSEPTIREWAEAYFDEHGRWPYQHAGLIPNSGGLTWMAVDNALRVGPKGLPGGSSLAVLLRKRRGSIRNVHSTPLTKKRILQWADAYHDRTGRWPTARSGEIPEAPGATWQAVMTALHSGYRGFRGGVTLGQFLAKYRGAPLQKKRRQRLTVAEVLEWADTHHARRGRWPIKCDVTIPGSAGETWSSVAAALFQGRRGLPRGSLAKLLRNHRRVRNMKDLAPLTYRQILKWADGHHRRTGKWPKRGSGPIPGTEGETWSTVCAALYAGSRGLKDGISLTRLLHKERGVPPWR
jgi:hypothetical protein